MLALIDFDCYITQGIEKIRVQSDKNEEDMSSLFDSVTSKYANRKSVFLPALKSNELNLYVVFQELFYFSRKPSVNIGNRMDLFILDPRYLDVLCDFNVNEIDFLYCKYDEYRTEEKTIEAYNQVSYMKYNEIFSQPKRTRYLEVLISSVRNIDQGRITLQFYGGENKLNFKEEGFAQIISEIRYQIKRKEEYAEKIDD